MRRKKEEGAPSSSKALKEAAVELFGKYGYEGTSVRMIAEKAGYTAGQITKSFESKEKLFTSIVADIYDSCSGEFDPLYSEYKALKGCGQLTEERAWILIERIVRIQMDFALGVEHRPSVRILWTHPVDESRDTSKRLLDLTKEKVENLLADLLREVFKNKRRLHCMVVSRAINGAIISFAEHPELLLDEVEKNEYMPQTQDWVRDYIFQFVMDSLHDEATKERKN